MLLTKNTIDNYTVRQLKLPLDIEKIIDISDPVYSFSEIMDSIDFTSHFAVKESKTGRPRYNSMIMLKIILFSFMENGYLSLRNIEKSCKTDIRYMWLLDGMAAPTFATFGNFIREELTDSIENIFLAINQVIFEKDQVDLEHVYIDGTKIEANANKYTWVWKKSCAKNRDKVFVKITELLEEINEKELSFLDVKFETRTEYAIEYLDGILGKYAELYNLNPQSFVSGKGHRKSIQQKHYQMLEEYRERLVNYARHIEICGEARNSYSKTDTGATFMRIKTDYMGNDQLLPAYNMQVAI
jgi:transposase